MDIDFKNKKLKKQLDTKRDLIAIHGPRRAKLIAQRLSEFTAVDNLKILGLLPGPRLHPLKGNRKGQLSADLDHPYRLIFIPNHKPVPQLKSGGLNPEAVTSVTILEITDTHE